MFSINVYTATFLPEDIADGDLNYRTERMEILEFDTITEIVEYLSREGLGWEKNDSTEWASQIDGSEILNHYTGEREEKTAHPSNITALEWMRVRYDLELSSNKIGR